MRRHIAMISVVFGGAAGVWWVLATEVPPAQAADGAPVTLEQQARELRGVAYEAFAAKVPPHRTRYADRYADSVQAGILASGQQPLTQARMDDLKSAIVEDVASPWKPRGPLVALEFELAQAKYTMQAIASYPQRTPELEKAFKEQIGVLGQALYDTVVTLIVEPVAKAAQAQDLPAPLTKQFAAEMRQDFEKAAWRRSAVPNSRLFKEPLSDDQLQAIRDTFARQAEGTSAMIVGQVMSALEAGRSSESMQAFGKNAMREWMMASIVTHLPEPAYSPEELELRRKFGVEAPVWTSARDEVMRTQGTILFLSQGLLLQSEAQGRSLALQ